MNKVRWLWGKVRIQDRRDLIKLGLEAKISGDVVHAIIEQTRSSLDKWPQLSRQYGVTQSNIEMIGTKLAQ